MQVVQELKFTYDTKIDPEIDEAVENLVFLLHSKGQLIKDSVTPNRGGATIVNRQAYTLENMPENVQQSILDAKVPDSLPDWPGKINYTRPQPKNKERKSYDPREPYEFRD